MSRIAAGFLCRFAGGPFQLKFWSLVFWLQPNPPVETMGGFSETSKSEKMNIEQVLQKHTAWLRDEDGGEQADLTRADLTGANLTRADLRMANLYEANLTGADLTGANLTGANLTRADLTGANLTRAKLTRADLSGAKGVYLCGPMPTSRRMVYFVRHEAGWMAKAGCFWGTLDELEVAVRAKHNCPVYLATIEILRKI